MKRIKLTMNKFAVVDDEDFIILKTMTWHCKKEKSGRFYAATLINRKIVRMHTFLINPSKGFMVDHRDGNGLNNRKINLRVCTNKQNRRNNKIYKNNSSGFKGVFKISTMDKYFAQIKVDGKARYLGSYATKEEAANAYDLASEKFFGEFGRTNRMIGLLQNAN